MTVPPETVRAAGLPSSYLQWVKRYGDDDFLRKCVNMGVPIRTSVAIDEQVISLLKKAGVEYDIMANSGPEFWANSALYSGEGDKSNGIYRSMMGDTGATGHLNRCDVEPFMSNSKPSRYTIAVAKEGQQMRGSKDGRLKAVVLNTARQPSVPAKTPHG